METIQYKIFNDHDDDDVFADGFTRAALKRWLRILLFPYHDVSNWSHPGSSS